MKHYFLFCIVFSMHSYGQTEITQDWNAFAQGFDVTQYQGGQFRFKGFVRVENGNKTSNARLWARVDKRKGTGFFDNMHKRPITSKEWREYVIEGNIDQKAVKLFIGGLYFGSSKYYFDKFTLEIKPKDGVWKNIEVANPGFENDSFQTDWKNFYKVTGFETKLITENAYEGGKALMVDASSRAEDSKFIFANNINIHYQEYGKGDTVLLLHGNSESIQSFNKQIPALSEQFYVIAIDSRGQGYSDEDGKKISYELMADDVIAFLNKLSIQRVNIVGWSDGGNIGLILAMNHPKRVKSLSIMGANLYNDNTSVDKKINKIFKEELARLEKLNRPEDRFRIQMINLVLKEPNIKPDSLLKIECPTLVMAGSKDVIKKEHTKLIASKIKNSKLIIFDKGTHYEPMNNPDRFNRTLIDFLAQLNR